MSVGHLYVFFGEMFVLVFCPFSDRVVCIFWVVKATEITRNINNAFGPGTANEHTVRWWFKKFCKGDESLEDEECIGWLLKVDSDQLRAITKADPLRTTQEIAEEVNIDIL